MCGVMMSRDGREEKESLYPSYADAAQAHGQYKEVFAVKTTTPLSIHTLLEF
jgi:hypothetical protein